MANFFFNSLKTHLKLGKKYTKLLNSQLCVHIHIQVIFLLIGTDLAFNNNDKFLFNHYTSWGRIFQRSINMEVSKVI